MSIAIGSAQSGAAIPSRFTCISRHVRKSASMCASLEPDRFAVFGYAHVPWFKKHQRAIDETRLPGGQERLDQAEAARSTLIGFGASSIGSFDAGYIQNEPHLGRYKEAIKRGELPVSRGIAVTQAERRTRAVIERLMCEFEVDLQAMANDTNCSTGIFGPALAALEPLRENGLVEFDRHIVRATPGGRPYVRNIAACFDDCQEKREQRYSRVV